MTDKDLIDLYLAGELDDASRAQLEAEIETNPELLREILDEQQIELALRVLLADGTADQQVTVSVLSDLRGAPIDEFKQKLMEKVKSDDARKQKEEAAIRVLPQAEPQPVDPENRPAQAPRVASPRPNRRLWAWGIPVGIAAAALLATLLHQKPDAPERASRAFLLSATPDVRVQRGSASFAANVDMTLEPGDRITTGEAGAAKIGFPDDPTRIEIRAQAQVHFVGGGKSKRFEILKGEIDAVVPPRAGEPLVVMTLHAELRAREAEFRLLDASDFTRLEVRKGSAEFTRRSDGRRIEVAALHFAVAGKDLEFVAKALGPSAPGAVGPSAVAVVRRVQGEAFVFNQSPAERLPLKAGQPLLEDQGIVTEGSKSAVVLDYSDTTRLGIGPDTIVRRLTDAKDKARKHVTLETGWLSADVTKQPIGRPMILATTHAEARVLGTRFTLAVESDQTRLQVEEGAVQFTQSRERESIVVRSGYAAIAAPGRPFEAIRVPGAPKCLEIDLAAGAAEGDGEWRIEGYGRDVRQKKVSRRAEGLGMSPASSFLYPVEQKYRAEHDEAKTEEILLEATAEVNQVTPDASPGLGAWGFGLAAYFANQNIILHSLQGDEGGSMFGFKDIKGIAFEHGREGRYRLKLRIERKPHLSARLSGKLWQGDREPDGWLIEEDVALEGPLTNVGFRTMRCACTFSSFRVQVLK